MSQLEIIHLRSFGEPLESLCQRIRESIREEGQRTGLVTLYRRDGLDTDITVHLHHLEPSGEKGPSSLGLHLASSLRSLGLLEHTLWDEC